MLAVADTLVINAQKVEEKAEETRRIADELAPSKAGAAAKAASAASKEKEDDAEEQVADDSDEDEAAVAVEHDKEVEYESDRGGSEMGESALSLGGGLSLDSEVVSDGPEEASLEKKREKDKKAK